MPTREERKRRKALFSRRNLLALSKDEQHLLDQLNKSVPTSQKQDTDISKVDQVVYDLLKRIRHIQALKSYIYRSLTPGSVRYNKACDYLRKQYSYIASISGVLDSIGNALKQQKTSTIDLGFTHKDLKEIQDAMRIFNVQLDVQYQKYNMPCLIIPMPEIVLFDEPSQKRLKLGPFLIHLLLTYDISKINVYSLIKLFPAHDKVLQVQSDYGLCRYHPLMMPDNGRICLGDGAAAIAMAYKQKRYFDVVELLLNLLANYNANAGHRPYVTPFIQEQEKRDKIEQELMQLTQASTNQSLGANNCATTTASVTNF